MPEIECYQNNRGLHSFLIRSIGEAPRCVMQDFYQLFHFIISKWQDGIEPTTVACLDYLK